VSTPSVPPQPTVFPVLADPATKPSPQGGFQGDPHGVPGHLSAENKTCKKMRRSIQESNFGIFWELRPQNFGGCFQFPVSNSDVHFLFPGLPEVSNFVKPSYFEEMQA
jgi:hypothetical protein